MQILFQLKISNHLIVIFRFEWLTPLIVRGYLRPLQMSNLWDVRAADEAQTCYTALERGWSLFGPKISEVRIEKPTKSTSAALQERQLNPKEELRRKKREEAKLKKKMGILSNYRLILAIFWAFGPRFLVSGVAKLGMMTKYCFYF